VPQQGISLRIETPSRRAKEMDAPRHAWFDTHDFYRRKRDSHFGIPEVMAHQRRSARNLNSQTRRDSRFRLA
jgi:hypothetical protein